MAAALGIRLEKLDLCPVCGSPSAHLAIEGIRDYLCGLPGEFRYVRCRDCGLTYQNPRPRTEDLLKCYAGYHTHETPALPESFTGPWRGGRRWIRGGVLARKFGYSHLAPSAGAARLACLLDVLPPIRTGIRCALGKGAASGLPFFQGEGRALDIGAGAGTYAAVVSRLGWDVTGVDFDPEAAAASRRRGLCIRTGTMRRRVRAGRPTGDGEVHLSPVGKCT
jgi:SAM-dependent methyltransferase